MENLQIKFSAEKVTIKKKMGSIGNLAGMFADFQLKSAIIALGMNKRDNCLMLIPF